MLHREVPPRLWWPLPFIPRHEDIICYGNVGCGKTHLASALIRLACQNNMKARFTTAADLVMTLRKAKNDGRLDKELTNWSKFDLITIDELGYLPIDPEGARLLFQVISNTYERSSLIITTNIEFSRWGTIFADDNIAAAIIDRLIHHGHLLRHQGQSWRVTHALMK
ncbi:ATP-binding protein [Actinomycetaceae bacterium WB03_NA08]|uniref:ATP-binding protein n=1 Tax=Scrofimicrobium canadense TaxID=2652290 RepID=A0A6N7VRG8_9ACTO|nr:ATP-binding protein [Scrofimicrobium canadense]MSS84359.1 ATP-binding protein [Scrofimicrobium canadense]